MRTAWDMASDEAPMFRNSMIAAGSVAVLLLLFSVLWGVGFWLGLLWVLWSFWPIASAVDYMANRKVKIETGQVGLLLSRAANRQLVPARILRPKMNAKGKPDWQVVDLKRYPRMQTYAVGKDKGCSGGTIDFVVVVSPKEGKAVHLSISYTTRLDDNQADIFRRFEVERDFMAAGSGVGVDQRIQMYVVRFIVDREAKAVPPPDLEATFMADAERKALEQRLAALCDAEAYAQFATHVTSLELRASVSSAWKKKK